MTQVLIDRATLEQMTVALEDSIDCVRHEYETYWGHGLPTRKAQIDSMKESLDRHEASITAGRAALANAEPAGWQPIETAPKDGRQILLFGDCRVTSGHWSAPSETPRIIYQDGFAPDTEWDEWEPYWGSWDGGFTEEHPPTHWMPLPAAPGETP